MDERAQRMTAGLQLLRVFRGIFLLGGVAFALAALGLAYKEFDDGNAAQAVGIALLGIMIGGGLAVGAGLTINWFMKSASVSMVQSNGPPYFEQGLTGRTDHWESVTGNLLTSTESASHEPEMNLTVELTTSVIADGVEEVLTLTPAHLFTQDDLRGNLDLIVSASPGSSTDRLTETILQQLQLEFDGHRTRLSPLAHEDNDPDGSFLIVLCYSVADLIEEFDFDRPGLEQWIDELAKSPGTVSVYWGDQFLGTVRVGIAD